jgi:septal ring factor EnvC (AmiA/AmiB activator)
MRSLSKTIAGFFCALALTAGTPDTFTRDEADALAAEQKQALADLQRLRSERSAVESEDDALSEQLIAAALQSRREEEKASDAARALDEIAKARTQKRMDLEAGESQLGQLISALAAVHRRQPPSLVVSPGRANEAIRRAIVMRSLSPRAAAKTKALRADIAALAIMERETRLETGRLEAAKAERDLQAAAIQSLSAEKRARANRLGLDMDGLAERARRLGGQVETLRELLAALEAAAPDAPGAKPARTGRAGSGSRPSTARAAKTAAPVAKGPVDPIRPVRMAAPVSGEISKRFGDKLAGGGQAEWVAWSTPAEAQVTAPLAGKVEFARPFRSYGSMLILRTSGNYHVILTGMSRIYVSEGQTVAAGEPVGVMPDTEQPELTLEVRLGDRVQDPGAWLETRAE